MRAKSSLHIRNKFLKMSFEHMSEFGLEQTSLRELCKNTGISSGSLYYWFNNKDELIIAAAEFGFDNISSRIFDCNFDDIKNIKDFFDANMSRIKKIPKSAEIYLPGCNQSDVRRQAESQGRGIQQ